MIDIPPTGIVCLVGSSKFRLAFSRTGHWLETNGYLVLCMSFFQHADGIQVTPEERLILEEVDKMRINLCDIVYVVNVNGYIGEATQKEIDYAIVQGKKVVYMEQV